MDQYYLKELTVPIPEDRLAVIRRGKSVEYETDRIYSPETKNTRVVRRVIGKVDPVNPGRMFPNEMYFQLFPENEVPEEVRNEFLRECEIRRQMRVIRKNPEEVAEGVVRGLSDLRVESEEWRALSRVESEEWRVKMSYTVLRRVFDEIYYAVEELAGKFPNEAIVPFKVDRINEVLDSLRNSVEDDSIKPFLRLIEQGLSYSDVLVMMKWYKVLPR